MSAGRMEISIDASGKHKAPLGVFDLVRSGAYEMGHTTSYYYKGKDAATTFFTTNPFGMTVTEMNAWYYYGGGMELQDRVVTRRDRVERVVGTSRDRGSIGCRHLTNGCRELDANAVTAGATTTASLAEEARIAEVMEHDRLSAVHACFGR